MNKRVLVIEVEKAWKVIHHELDDWINAKDSLLKDIARGVISALEAAGEVRVS
jgi:hypothetical protein